MSRLSFDKLVIFIVLLNYVSHALSGAGNDASITRQFPLIGGTASSIFPVNEESRARGRTDRIRRIKVTVAFETSSLAGSLWTRLDVPLREKRFTDDFPSLPTHPESMEILGGTVQLPNGRTDAYAQWEDVVCIAYLVSRRGHVLDSEVDHLEEKPEDYPVWFTARDGKVTFEDPQQPWFLGGREVAAYECT